MLDVAARLREAAEPRTVLVSDRARLAAHGDFRFGPAVRLGPSTARPLIAADWAADRPPPESEPPIVGREDETRVVLSLIDEAAASGRPRLITIVATAGVGKSRLVREVVAAAVQRRPDIRVLRGRCLAAGDGVTYWALGDILRDACGIALGESGQVAQQKLRTRLRQLLSIPDQDGGSEVDDTVFALAATAAIPMPDNPLDDAPPRAVADALARAWPRFATAAASSGPLIMVIEDLHWAGKPLLDMLVRLVARSSGPVVVLTTARPEFLEQNPGFGAASADVSMISLRSLTEQASRELLDSLPRASALDAQRRDDVLARAEGNPYFLEQLVAHMADGRSGALPDTLHALLAARVDALPVAREAAASGGRRHGPGVLGRAVARPAQLRHRRPARRPGEPRTCPGPPGVQPRRAGGVRVQARPAARRGVRLPARGAAGAQPRRRRRRGWRRSRRTGSARSWSSSRTTTRPPPTAGMPTPATTARPTSSPPTPSAR